MTRKPKEKTETESLSFENAVTQLQTIVEQMEKGDLSLENSLQQFEQGIALIRQCQQTLQQAELKVQQLVDRDGKLQLRPFETTTDETGS